MTQDLRLRQMVVENEKQNLRTTFKKRNTDEGRSYDYRMIAQQSIDIIRKWKVS